MSDEGPDPHSYAGYAAAFAIFARYSSEQFGVAAEHDEIFAGPTPELVSDEDRQELERLGWRTSADDCFAKFT